jgi:hypothetical protein
MLVIFDYYGVFRIPHDFISQAPLSQAIVWTAIVTFGQLEVNMVI